MKIVITKKGVVDCTSDSRTHDMQSLQDGIEGAIKILDKENMTFFPMPQGEKTRFNWVNMLPTIL